MLVDPLERARARRASRESCGSVVGASRRAPRWSAPARRTGPLVGQGFVLTGVRAWGAAGAPGARRRPARPQLRGGHVAGQQPQVSLVVTSTTRSSPGMKAVRVRAAGRGGGSVEHDFPAPARPACRSISVVSAPVLTHASHPGASAPGRRWPGLSGSDLASPPGAAAGTVDDQAGHVHGVEPRLEQHRVQQAGHAAHRSILPAARSVLGLGPARMRSIRAAMPPGCSRPVETKGNFRPSQRP